MITDERAKWSAADRVWRLASQNLQLLAMLEVLQEHTAADIDHLALATHTTQAFPAQIRQAERELPIDPGGRARDALTTARAKARLLHLLALRANRAQPVTSGQLPRVAQSLRQLADACESLCNWIAAHEEAFEKPDPTEPMPLEAA
ncbi:hypothetical protein QTH89_11815 [Variovorax sp. J22G21]|uniref:hypothetical protein n=1 Tax=Variovorax fucosicus TaxID=3053517 RepID=UPI002575FBE1|nr:MULTISPECIES: hypothetical protein [unclassified Variovorax]MDM0040517.1 hypothetical protein [Variovorax sp. J22R193]MDM0058635.1 hypothetical protein [Variovorax sp. J22G47]MDM0061890.1 hypothetical protein [Variovorax sp. J22G21]